MTTSQPAGERARSFFDEVWASPDPWELGCSEFEQQKYGRELGILDGRRYGRVLEIGCGAGEFTRKLAGRADQLVALDVSAAAIERARAAAGDVPAIEYRVGNIMEYDVAADGPWDLIVMNETIYYLGWLYTFFEVGWLSAQIVAATRDNGHFLMANTSGGLKDYLLRPWLIRTYRDLFLNVGYALEREEVFTGQKNGLELEVLISLFAKKPGAAEAAE